MGALSAILTAQKMACWNCEMIHTIFLLSLTQSSFLQLSRSVLHLHRPMILIVAQGRHENDTLIPPSQDRLVLQYSANMVAERGVGTRRAAWRIIASVEQKERTEAREQQADDAKEYIFALEGELQKTCADILTLIDEDLILSTGEPKVLYYKTETIEQRASKLDGSCAAQAPEWEELQRLGDEELVTVRDTNKLLNDCDELIPEWLNSVKGVVDSEELPLNIYCETLLQNKILRVIKKKHVTKYLEMLAEIAELKDDLKKFYERCVKCMKLGIVLRFNTSKPGDEQNDFAEYVDHTKEGQNDSCHITGESIAVVSSSSFLENLRKNGHEMLYVADPRDEYAVHQPKEFDGKC